jgi:hypothetical protein
MVKIMAYFPYSIYNLKPFVPDTMCLNKDRNEVVWWSDASKPKVMLLIILLKGKGHGLFSLLYYVSYSITKHVLHILPNKNGLWMIF